MVVEMKKNKNGFNKNFCEQKNHPGAINFTSHNSQVGRSFNEGCRFNHGRDININLLYPRRVSE